jgi:hypothetical protein
VRRRNLRQADFAKASSAMDAKTQRFGPEQYEVKLNGYAC